MKLKQEARVLRGKALSSLTVAVAAFNSPHEEGRITQVLLFLQHAFEMLLKAAWCSTVSRCSTASSAARWASRTA